MSKFWVRRTGGMLFAADVISRGLLLKLPVNSLAEVESRVPRNAKFHRMVFALFGLIASAFDEDVEVVRHKLLVSIGEFTEVHFNDGMMDRRPNSLSYSSMDETRFKEMFERLVKATYAIYGILPVNIRREIDTMLAPDLRR